MRQVAVFSSWALVRAVSAVALVLLACTPSPATPAPAASAPAGAPGPAAAPAASSGPVTLKAGLIGGTSDAGIYIAIEKGYFAQEGIEVVPEIVPSTTVMVGALGAGQLDLLGPAIAASLFNAGARQVALRLVADKGSTPDPEWDFATLMVRRDLIDGGQVRDYADLRGLTIALAGQANAPEIELAKALEKGGLALGDVHLTIISFPDMITAQR